MNVKMKISRSELSKFKKWTRALDLAEGKRVKNAIGAAKLEFETKAREETPVDTGTLRRNNQTEIIDGGYGVKMFNNTEYADFIEYGTSRMKAQPFFGKGFYAAVQKFKQMLRR